MKKYTTLPNIDYTDLISQAVAYLNATYDVEDAAHHTTAFTLLGESQTLVDVPSLATAFADLAITAGAIGHYSISTDALFNHAFGANVLFIPLMDCNGTVIKFFDTVPGAVFDETTSSYPKSSCILTETVPLTTGILVKSGQVFTIQTDPEQTELADILVVFFVEDTDSLLA
jgi:hypothetical protein